MPRYSCPGVGQQLERKSLFGAELLVAVRTIHADANDHRILLVVLRLVTLEVMRLNGTAAGPVFGVKIEDHPLPLEVVETDAGAVLRGQRKVRGGLADRRHRRVGGERQGCKQQGRSEFEFHILF